MVRAAETMFLTACAWLLPCRPHNMCVNVGAIMTAGVLASGHPDKSVSELLQHTMDMWSQLSGNIGEVSTTAVSCAP
jgi:glutaminase